MTVLRVSLLWGEDVTSTEAIQRAESRALELITQAGTSPEEAKRGFDLWKQRKRGEPFEKNAKRLHDVWVAAENAAEAELETGLSDGRLVCGELALGDIENPTG